MTSPVAHFNGQLLPMDRISISPLDRGFIFGDGVYDSHSMDSLLRRRDAARECRSVNYAMVTQLLLLSISMTGAPHASRAAATPVRAWPPGSDGPGRH